MRWIIGSSLRARVLVAAMAAGMIFFGVRQLREMPVDVVPEFSQPYVEIQTEAPGLSAAEVEALITVPLEADMLNGTAWVDEIASQSMPGLSSIMLTFQPGTDILKARQMVIERLTEVHSLPNVAKPPVMLNPVSSANRVMMIGLSSEKLSLIDMSVLARWTVSPRLTGVPGVANVSIWGERRRQLQVQVDPERLAEAGVTLQQTINTTGNALWFSPLTFLNASTPGASGFFDTPNQRLGVRHQLPITTPEELAQVTVEGTDKRLGDIAEVVENHQPMIGDAIVNDEPSIVLVVEKFPWAHTVEVTEAVEEALDALRPGLAGLEMDSTLFRPATYIEMALGNLTNVALIGGGLAAVALAAFLMNARAVLAASLSMLTAFVAGAALLYLCGLPLNMLALAGLAMAVGAVVDDAVIDVENILRRLRQRRQEPSNKSFGRIIMDAALEMRGPALFATAILLLAVTPAFFMDGVHGAFLNSAAIAFAVALATSMLVALTVTPALCMLLLPSAPLRGNQSGILRQLRHTYNSVLAKSVRNPRPAFVAACVLAVAGWALLPRVRSASLIPPLKERNLVVEIETPPGTSHPEMSRIASQATRELRSIPGVGSVSAHVGRAVLSDHVGDVNTGELWVSIDRDADYDTTVDRIRQVVDGFAGLDIDTRTYLRECIDDAQGDEEGDVVVRVYGEEWSVLRAKADEVKQTMTEIDGIASAEVKYPIEEPQVEIELDLEAAKKYGLKPGDVRRSAAALLSGIEVGFLFEQQKVFDVVVWGVPKLRDNLTSIGNMMIDAPGGGHARLADVAKVRIAPAANVIKHEAVARYIDVGGDVAGRNLSSVAADVQRRLNDIELPLEYRAELRGESAARVANSRRMLSFSVAAAVGAFLVLQASVGSWRLASALFLTMPAALVGGLLTALAMGDVWSLGVVSGVAAVLVVAVRQALTLVGHYRRLAAKPEAARIDAEVASYRAQFDQPDRFVSADATNGEVYGPSLVQRGTWERFVPILMTAAITAAAVVPLLFIGNVAGSEILHPMAAVLLGGLVTSTLFALVCVPSMFLMFPPSRGAELDDLAVAWLDESDLDEALTKAGAEKELQLTR